MTVRDASGTAVSGVAVTGAWNPTSAATPSGCTTNASGQCTITAGSGAFPSTQLSESWTVFGLGASGYSYDSASNSANSITLSRGCSAGAVCATDLGDAYSTTPNSGSASVTLSGVNGTAPSNSTVLVLIARDGDQSTDAISSIDGTAITGAASVNSVGSMSSNANAFTRAWVYRATGAGTASGTVTVTFNNADNIATLVEVLVLSGENTRTPVVQSVTNTGTSSTAAALLTSPSSSNAEIALVAEAKDTATQMSTPTGWTQFTWQHKPGANGTNVATYSGPSAAASQNVTLGTSAAWGTTALEIARAT